MSNKMHNQIKKVFIRSGEQKILNYLANQKRWRTVKEIIENTNLSKSGIHLCLNNLSKLNLIERDQKGKTHLYRINFPSPSIKQFKVLENIADYSGLIEKLKPLAQKIILFGSASRGENFQDSDIDLFIVTHSPDEVKKIAAEEKLLKDKLQLVIRSPLAYSRLEKKDLTFYQEVERGIILWEKEEHYD